MHTRTAPWLFVLVPFVLAACTGVEDREGGLFEPFPDAVTGAAGSGESGGGGMELPPASDFVPEEPTDAPLVVDTGEPPAVVAGDDDDSSSAADDALAAVEAVVEPPVEPPTPPEVIEAITEPPVVHAPVYVEVAPEPPVQVQVAPPQAIPAVVSPLPGTCEAALTMSAPLSEIALIASIPDAAPPRAIVRFPSGEERVVQVGDLLGDSGAKVLSITAGSIKLAEIAVSEPDRPSIVTHYLHQSR